MKRYKKSRGGYLYHILRLGSDTQGLCGTIVISGNVRQSHPGRSRLCNRCRTVYQSKNRISG